MTKNEFAAGVRFMRLAFNLPEVPKAVLAIWYELAGVSKIGAAEWQSITRRIAATEERFPSNLVRTVLAYREPRRDEIAIPRPPDMSAEEERENKARLQELIGRVGGWQ